MLCRWDAADGSRTVLLECDAVDRVRSRATEAFLALPRRGAETGGLLLGHFDPDNDRVVWVEAIEEIPSEHRYGPSYTLSDADRAQLADAVRRENQAGRVVGFFRTYAGREPAIDAADEDLILTHFRDRRLAFLLIKPVSAGECTAAFLFWDREELASSPALPRFPLDPAALQIKLAAEEIVEEPAPPPPAEAAPPLVEVPEGRSLVAAAAPPAETDSEPEPAPQEAVGPAPQSEPIPPFVPSYASRRRFIDEEDIGPEELERRPGRQKFWLALAACVVLGLSVAFVYGLWKTAQQPRWTPLRMTAVRDGSGFRVTWDRSSPIVARATRGMLRISDGPAARDIDLDQQAIRAGQFSYEPIHQDVTFRLELFDGALATTGDSLQVLNFQAPGTPAARAVPAPAAKQPPPAAPPPRPRPPARATSSAADRARPGVATPPEVAREVQPGIPAGIRSRIQGRVVVPVQVSVNASGRVTKAVARGEGDGLYRYLANRAQQAAYLWRFTPARSKAGKRVASTTVVHVVFTR